MYAQGALYCDFCMGPISSFQPWAYEKNKVPNSNPPAYVVTHYHSEAFPGLQTSCWEKHKRQVSIDAT